MLSRRQKTTRVGGVLRSSVGPRLGIEVGADPFESFAGLGETHTLSDHRRADATLRGNKPEVRAPKILLLLRRRQLRGSQ